MAGGSTHRLDRTTGNLQRGDELADRAAGQFRVVGPDVTQQPVVAEPDAGGEARGGGGATALGGGGGETANSLERAFLVGSVRRGAGVRVRGHVRVLGGEVFLQQAYHFCQAARQGRVVLPREQRLPETVHLGDQLLVLLVDRLDADHVLRRPRDARADTLADAYAVREGMAVAAAMLGLLHRGLW